MKATQYKVTYLKHGHEETEVFGSIADAGSVENDGFRILKIQPQVVVDQLANSNELLCEARKEAAYVKKSAKIKGMYDQLEECLKQAGTLRAEISIEFLKRNHR